MILATTTGVVVLVLILLPFFIGEGGLLAAASSIHSADQLTEIKQLIVKRYVQDKRSFDKKEIGQRAWRARSEFLIRRYVDTARRLDFVEQVKDGS